MRNFRTQWHFSRALFKSASRVLLLISAILLFTTAGLKAQDGTVLALDINQPVVDLTPFIVVVAEDPNQPHEDGRLFRLHIENKQTEDVTRIFVFAFPLMDKSGLLGAPMRAPVMSNFRLPEAEIKLNVRPGNAPTRYAWVQVTLPSEETTLIEFRQSGTTRGAGLYLWDPSTLSRLTETENWRDGVLLGIVTVLLAFGVGTALTTGRMVALANGAFIISAWIFEFIALRGDRFLLSEPLAAHYGWHGASLSLIAISGLWLTWASVRFSQSAQRLRIGFIAVCLLLAFVGTLSLLGVPGMNMAARLLTLAVGLVIGYLFIGAMRAGSFAHDRVIPGGALTLLAGALAAILPLFDWGNLGFLLDPVLNGMFIFAICLLTFTFMTRSVQETIVTVPAEPEKYPAAAPVAMGEESEKPPIHEKEDRYALGVAAAHQGLWDWTMEGDRLYLSASIDGLLGLSAGSLERSEAAWAARIHEDDRENYRNALRSYLNRGNVSFNLEFRIRHEDGSYPWFQLRATCLPGLDGEAERCVGVISDITPTKLAENRLMETALQDPLTGLANRVQLLEQVSMALDHAKGVLTPLLLVVDLDRFKTINDGLGHFAGDEVLVHVANRLSAVAGSDDLVSRIGSDEFAILLFSGAAPSADNGKQLSSGPRAEEVANYLLDLMSQPIDVAGQEVFVTVSIGIAEASQEHGGAADLLKDAEAAMYRAKKNGGSRFEFYAEGMRPNTGEALSLETDLRRALSRQQMEVYFQPIIDLHQGTVVGFEALLRWRHPDKGILSPDEFVGIAEETDMIVPMGRFVLSMASMQLAQWQRTFQTQPPLFVSVNVSAKQLKRHDFANDVKDVLRASELIPGTLKLEVTESTILEDPDLAEKLLIKAKELGAGVSLDDFGTGFASLSNLQRFPFDTLKIDRSFVSTMESRTDSTVIVKTVIGMAKELDLHVIAEGLETEQDIHKLLEMGCDYGQGYIFGKPMTSSAAEKFLKEISSEA